MNANDAVLDKIRKLLALAEGKGATPGEAAAAAAQAQRLMMKHNIERLQLQDAPQEQIVSEEGWRGGRILSWIRILVAGVARANGCRVVLWTGDAYGRGQKAWIEVVGTKSNIEVCRYLLVYLQREINRLTEEQTVLQTRAYKNAFRVGAAEIVSRRLVEERQAARDEAQQASSTALVRLDQDEARVDTHMSKRSDLAKYSTAGVSDGGGRLHGRVAGASIPINRGLDGKPVRQLGRG